MRRIALFLALWGLAIPAPAFAAGPDPDGIDAGRALVENFVRDIKTLRGSFEQSLVDADNEIVEKSSGTLEIQRPGQFRWAYIEPYEQLLVADGMNVWSYDSDLAQVTVKPQADILSNTPAMLLGGSPDALDQFDFVGSFTDRGTVWVTMRPKNTDNGFNKVELGFNNGELTRMMFFDNLEQTTLIALFNVTLNEAIDARHFWFEPPQGVDVVGTPAGMDRHNIDDTAES